MSVIVLGSINVDLAARVTARPKVGETVLASDFKISPGGKGANQALAARRLGAQVQLHGAVGNDPFAEVALKLLQADGVELTNVLRLDDSLTGVALIQIDEQGQNSITVASGANFTLGEVALARLEASLKPGDILLLQCEIPLEVVQKAVALAKIKGVRVLFDPAPAPARLPAELFAVDIIMPNQSEAETLLDRAVGGVEQAREAAGELCRRGAKVAIVKMGEQGVVWATDDQMFFEPAFKVQAFDSTGAGDAFAGALAMLLDSGRSLEQAVGIANKVAALSTRKAGAQESFPYAADVQLEA